YRTLTTLANRSGRVLLPDASSVHSSGRTTDISPRSQSSHFPRSGLYLSLTNLLPRSWERANRRSPAGRRGSQTATQGEDGDRRSSWLVYQKMMSRISTSTRTNTPRTAGRLYHAICCAIMALGVNDETRPAKSASDFFLRVTSDIRMVTTKQVVQA